MVIVTPWLIWALCVFSPSLALSFCLLYIWHQLVKTRAIFPPSWSGRIRIDPSGEVGFYLMPYDAQSVKRALCCYADIFILVTLSNNTRWVLWRTSMKDQDYRQLLLWLRRGHTG